MWCEYRYRDDVINIFHPDGEQWLTDHTLKHVINGYSGEGWKMLLHLDESTVSEMKVGSADFKKVSELYLKALKEVIENDYLNPRNASYSFRDDGKDRYFIIVDDSGFSVVIKRMGRSYILVTGYGMNDMDTRYLGDGFFQFKKLFNDKVYRRNGAIAEWNGKFESKTTIYKNLIKELPKNWEISL